MRNPIDFYIRDVEGRRIGIVVLQLVAPGTVVATTSICREGDVWNPKVGRIKAYGRMKSDPHPLPESVSLKYGRRVKLVGPSVCWIDGKVRLATLGALLEERHHYKVVVRGVEGQRREASDRRIASLAGWETSTYDSLIRSLLANASPVPRSADENPKIWESAADAMRDRIDAEYLRRRQEIEVRLDRDRLHREARDAMRMEKARKRREKAMRILICGDHEPRTDSTGCDV